MMNFKNHKRAGFSFMEVVASLLIMSLLLTALLSLQASVFARFTKNNFRFTHGFSIKNAVLQMRQEKKNLEQPVDLGVVEDATVRYQIAPVSRDSSLARFKGLQQYTVSSKWLENGKEKIMEYKGYLFFPEKKDEKESKKVTS